MARLFLIDGSNHAFRVQFALPPRHTSQGFPTRVLYGFTLLFQKMIRTWQPDYVVVCFDHGPSFRNRLFPDYKGHRPEMPEDLRQQWGLLDGLVEAFGFRAIWVPDYEADDVIGTLAKRFAGEDLEVFLVTGDKDFCQLVGDNITILDEQKGSVLDHAGVVEKFGVPPERVIDVLGLMGDASDNIPGVTKVGEKTAIKLIHEWGSMDGALAAAAAGKVKGAVGERLVAEADIARLSRTLATIHTEVPLDHTLADLTPRGMQVAELKAMFDAWEFGAVARKLLPEEQPVIVDAAWSPARGEALAAAVARVRAGETPAMWPVFVDADAAAPELVGVAFSGASPGAVWFDFQDPEARESALNLISDPSVRKWTHASKPLFRAMIAMGRKFEGLEQDSRLIDYVLFSNRKQHGLADQAMRHFNHTLSLTARDVAPAAQAATAATEAAWFDAQVVEKVLPLLTEGQRFVLEQIELPLVPVLAAMEARGIRLDKSRIGEVERDIAARLDAVEAECHQLAGKVFSIRSRHELRDVLFTDLRLPPSKKVKDGWSTDSDVLEKLADRHPLPAKVLEHRSLDKLRGTYLTKLPGYVGADGRIHSTFQQEVAATGRLSSIDPNLQNIPIRTFEGRRIRDCFVPDPGYVFLSADYSQVELRVLAHFTQDPILIHGFAGGEDIHRRTAIEVFGVAPDAVTVEVRSAAKAINFGLIYGMSAFRLANDLQIPQEQAQRYMDEYFARMPAVRGWIEETKTWVRQHGHVDTLFGRRRLIPEIHAAQFNERMAAEREAVNTRIQGTAADIIKLAMLRVDAALRRSGSGARMLLQVHDELLLEVPEHEIDAVRRLVETEMAAAASLAVPLVVNTSVGLTWNEAHG
jgi:DNA polymerase-1